MSIKHRIISIISAVCLLGSAACFSVFAADSLTPSGDEETAPAAVEPTAPAVTENPVVEPAAPEPEPVQEPIQEPAADPTVVDPQPTDPGYTDDPTTYAPEYTENPTQQDNGETTYSPTYSDVITEENYPQPTYTPPESYYTQPYVDTTQQYNQYLYNTTQAEYDDNYIYMPQYEEPTESLISTPPKPINTDELTSADWRSIVLDLSNGTAAAEGGTQSFDFIKDNEEEGDTDMMWLVYLGTVLIIASILLIVYVIVSTSKANAKHEYYYV